mmetsp:Transcript_36255/g.108711  ORF Transcript_36255/g.108711 Transcript_36255/m.108711 type:complete len:245 (-) Transcript_36255:366-1100(-)
MRRRRSDEKHLPLHRRRRHGHHVESVPGRSGQSPLVVRPSAGDRQMPLGPGGFHETPVRRGFVRRGVRDRGDVPRPRSGGGVRSDLRRAQARGDLCVLRVVHDRRVRSDERGAPSDEEADRGGGRPARHLSHGRLPRGAEGGGLRGVGGEGYGRGRLRRGTGGQAVDASPPPKLEPLHAAVPVQLAGVLPHQHVAQAFGVDSAGAEGNVQDAGHAADGRVRSGGRGEGEDLHPHVPDGGKSSDG